MATGATLPNHLWIRKTHKSRQYPFHCPHWNLISKSLYTPIFFLYCRRYESHALCPTSFYIWAISTVYDAKSCTSSTYHSTWRHRIRHGKPTSIGRKPINNIFTFSVIYLKKGVLYQVILSLLLKLSIRSQYKSCQCYRTWNWNTHRKPVRNL